MPSTFLKHSNVSQIMNTLPKNQFRHSCNVAIFARLLTKEVYGRGLYRELAQSEEYNNFGDATLYHDIGKAWVPLNILLKPGALTAQETRMVRKHVLFSEELFNLIDLGSVSGMPNHLIHLAHDSAVYHHEWWNGQGYPYGLSQEEIPLIARVTSVCDVYDAITNDRPYRKAHPHEYACHEIEANAGTQFDPEIAQVFLDHEAAFHEILKSAFAQG